MANSTNVTTNNNGLLGFLETCSLGCIVFIILSMIMNFFQLGGSGLGTMIGLITVGVLPLSVLAGLAGIVVTLAKRGQGINVRKFMITFAAAVVLGIVGFAYMFAELS